MATIELTIKTINDLYTLALMSELDQCAQNTVQYELWELIDDIHSGTPQEGGKRTMSAKQEKIALERWGRSKTPTVIRDEDRNESVLLSAIANTKLDLESAKLTGGNFVGCDFTDCNLEKSDLSFSNLSFAKFDNANLSNANLTGAIVIGVDFRNTNLKKAKTDGIIQGCEPDLNTVKGMKNAITFLNSLLEDHRYHKKGLLDLIDIFNKRINGE